MLLAFAVIVIGAWVLWKFSRPSSSPRSGLPPVSVEPGLDAATIPRAQPRAPSAVPPDATAIAAAEMPIPAKVVVAPSVSAAPPPADAVAAVAADAPLASEAGAPQPPPLEGLDTVDLVDPSGFVELYECDAQAADMPGVLSALDWKQESGLTEARRDELMDAIGSMPCPPASLRSLLAPDFMERVGPAELTQLLRGEPLITAKVLATVNASFYGLSQPVEDIEHAVAFLGLDTVRNICVQYLMAQAFKPGLSASQHSFDGIWRASSMASELALRLGKALDLPDYGTLATKVVLAFVGHLTTAALLPRDAIDAWLMRSRIERAQLEQKEVGLSAGEIGPLVLRLWGLPDGLVDDVAASSRVLVTPASECDPASVPHLALMYLCIGLGERLALGKMSGLAGYDPADDRLVENYHLRSYLQHPALAGLKAVLNSPEMAAVVQQMRGTGASWR